MDSSNALRDVADELSPVVRPAAVLRGTARGLEFHVWAGASRDAISTALQKRLDEAPGFFRGSDVRVRVEDGTLPAGTLTTLDELAEMFELKIVEVAAATDAVPQPTFAAGSGGNAPARAPLSLAKSDPAAPELASTEAVLEADGFDDEPTGVSRSLLAPTKDVDAELIADLKTTLVDKEALISAAATELAARTAELSAAKSELIALKLAAATPSPIAQLADAPGTRIMTGPVRSGVILEHVGNLFIFGDVNPGAEVRATGNIIVLGRLRGTAHAGISNEHAFVLALWLQPQQLRIGRQVARAADSDLPSAEAEIAYGTSDRIVVERYAGRLPRNLSI